jgi:predicted nucleic acid-binding protein
VFADTQYWIGLFNPKDQWAAEVQAAKTSLQNTRIVTTEEVLTEVLNAFSKYPHLRRVAILYVDGILNDPGIVVLWQSHDSFRKGYELYRARLDKQYSLTDCVSMVTMRREGITETLTHDRHFEQEGFVRLI